MKYLGMHAMNAMMLKRRMTRSEDEVKDTYKGWLLFKFKQEKV